MVRDELSVLSRVLAVAEERSFTGAAECLGVSASHAQPRDRGLEERSGVRPLARTTRSVTPTDPGERLIARLRSSADGRRIRSVALTARGRELIIPIFIPIFRQHAAVIRGAFAGVSAKQLRQQASGKRQADDRCLTAARVGGSAPGPTAIPPRAKSAGLSFLVAPTTTCDRYGAR